MLRDVPIARRATAGVGEKAIDRLIVRVSEKLKVYVRI